LFIIWYTWFFIPSYYFYKELFKKIKFKRDYLKKVSTLKNDIAINSKTLGMSEY